MLFKHADEKTEPKKTELAIPPVVDAASAVSVEPVKVEKDVSPAALRELLEKNLKWSQIIYEQNRKINGKLFWTAFANWVRLIILVGTFAAAAWFLPPLVGNVFNQYNSIMTGITDPSSAIKGGSAADLCKLLPANLQDGCKNITSNPSTNIPKQ
ncbi:MAG: hypothetical protein WC725_00045 [Patescibacteria group bacterium]|jgi:hypothetical protein